MDAGPLDCCECESLSLIHFSAARLISDHIIAQEEYGLLTELAPLNSPNALSSTYATLISPLTAFFTSTLGSLGSLIKRNLNKNTFLALYAYLSLSELQTPWTEIMSKRADRKDNELKEGLHSIRASCLRSFPEFLADMRLAGLGKGGETGTGLAEFTITVRGSHIRAAGVAADTDRPWFMVWPDCTFLERLLAVKDAAASALLTLGDGNWRMGEGTQVGKTKPIEVDEKTVLEHFTCTCLASLSFFLDPLTRTTRRRCRERRDPVPPRALADEQAPRLWRDLPPEQHLLPTHATPR